MDLLHPRLDGPGRLRALLGAGELVVAPGAYDAFSARLAALAGFPAVYLTGFGASASLLGRPDVGLLTLSEMAGQAARLAAAVDVPVIADADTGYGNPLNVIRTVQAYEAAGVAALHLEDQVLPKRCGHMEGKELIPAAEMAAKVRAAAAARQNPDFVLIARTDARAVEGFDAALDRLARCLDAGADVAFLEAPESEEEIERTAVALAPAPLLFNWVEKARSAPVSRARLAELGYAIVIYPISALLAAAGAVQAALAALAAGEPPAPALSFDEFNRLIGLDEVRALEARFGQDR
ncbi:MAG: oxaloacetate decarboxylase [Acidimicrobiales bacterium]